MLVGDGGERIFGGDWARCQRIFEEAYHKPITFGFSLKRLLEQPDFTIISSPVPDRTNVWRVNVVLVFSCPTSNGGTYSLLINQALVKYTGQKWLVIEWPDIEETNP